MFSDAIRLRSRFIITGEPKSKVKLQRVWRMLFKTYFCIQALLKSFLLHLHFFPVDRVWILLDWDLQTTHPKIIVMTALLQNTIAELPFSLHIVSSLHPLDSCCVASVHQQHPELLHASK